MSYKAYTYVDISPFQEKGDFFQNQMNGSNVHVITLITYRAQLLVLEKSVGARQFFNFLSTKFYRNFNAF